MHEQTKFNQVMAKDLDELKANAGTLTRLERMMEAHFSRQPGKLPGQPQVNPNAECKALHTLRSGTQYKDPPMTNGVETQASEQEEPVLEQVLPFPPLQDAAGATGAQTDAPAAQKGQPEPAFRSETISFRSEMAGPEGKNVDTEKKKAAKSVPEAPYMPPLPFPRRLAREKEDLLFKRFWEMLKEVHITIPFADVFTQVPIYAKFLKDLCTGKKSCEELKTVVLKSKMPPKLSDPGRFALPCTIGKATIKHALCDMGASVSLMPRTVYEKIGLGELRPTMMTLQLADSSVRLPLGVLEDVPVCVGKFVVPCDFVVIEMEEDKEVPIILGRPFLRTAGVMMDARDGTILVRVGGEELHFSIDHAMKCPSSTNTCCAIGDIEPTTEEALEEQYHDAFERYQSSLSDVQEAIGVEETIEKSNGDQKGNETPPPRGISDRNPPISDRNGVSEIELKPLSATVRYEFLGSSQKYPVIANPKPDSGQKQKNLVENGAIGYSIDDLKGYDKSLAVSLSGLNPIKT